MSDIKNEIEKAMVYDLHFRSSDQLKSWFSSLITTIESQKEEIEKFKALQKENEEIIKRKLYIKQVAIDNAMTEIASFKAITELAVKGLKEIKPVIKWKVKVCDKDCICPFCDSMLVINLTLSEIERLQNGTT